MFEKVQLIKGSSDLLNIGILPIGGDRVSKFNELFTIDDLISSGINNEEASSFYTLFGESRIKKGCTSNLKGMIDTLLGRVKTRIKVENGSSHKESRHIKVKEVFNPPSDYKYVRLDNPSSDEDIKDFATKMKNGSSFSSQYGTSGTGKGTRLSQLLTFFYYLGFKFKYEFVLNDKDQTEGAKRDLKTIGMYCDDLNLFILGRWVKSNRSGLYSLSGVDTFTGEGNFDLWVSLVDSMKNRNYCGEGYVAHDTGLLYGDRLVEYGHKKVHKVGYMYDNIEQLIDRVVQRSKNPCKGVTAFSQNLNAKKFIDHDIKYFLDNPYIIPNKIEMYKFDADLNTYGVSYLEFMGASKSLVNEFRRFCLAYPTLRHYSDIDKNYEMFESYKYNERLEYNESMKHKEDYPLSTEIIKKFYESCPYV